MAITIKKASKKDSSSVMALNKSLFDYEKRFNDEYNLNWTYSDIGHNYFKRRIEENGIVLVAKDDNNIVGYILAFIDSFPFRKFNPIAEIENMYIEETYRDKGLGSRLIGKIKEIARKKGAKRLKVTAVTDNSQALSFYRKNGFEDFDTTLEMNL